MEGEIVKKRIDRLLARSAVYSLLALLFRIPGEEHKKLLSERTYVNCLNSMNLFCEEEAEIFRSRDDLIGILKKISFEDWLAQHQSLFGHSAHGDAPPYELEYGEEHSHRQPQELGDIAAFYEAFGLKLASDVHERVDHVAVELDFLHFLTLKEAYALAHDGLSKAKICAEATRLFLADHLGRWLPVWTFRMTKIAKEGLYKNLGGFAFHFIVKECSLFGIEPGPRDLPLRVLEKMEEVGCQKCPFPSFSGNNREEAIGGNSIVA